jgi:hypothetical protein
LLPCGYEEWLEEKVLVMDRREAIQTIVSHCEDEAGFLIQLRVHNTFNAQKYEDLKNAILVYAKSIVEEANMSRQVAGCLFYLHVTLGEVLSILDERYGEVEHPKRGQVIKAHSETFELINILFREPEG